MGTITLRNTCCRSKSLELFVTLAVAVLAYCPTSARCGDVTAVSVDAASRVTKLYGAGGIRGLES